MRRQGPGYRDFEEWGARRKFARGENRAAIFMTDPLLKPSPKTSGEPHRFLFRGALDYRSVPIRRLLDTDGADASVVRPFPHELGMQVFVYSRDHDPPHFHIKLLSRDLETRYAWPSLQPLKGDLRLTGSNAKSLTEYWTRHKRSIEQKLRAVYPDAAL
jgi:hypothetical protein